MEVLGLEGKFENSLISKLQSAIKSLEKDRTNAAVNKLNAFIHEVEAQRDKKIHDEDADVLQSMAQVIIDLLSG